MPTAARSFDSTYLARAPLPLRMERQLGELFRFRHLVRYLVSTSLRTENVGTVFGFLWWMLDPLLLMAVYTLLIDVVLRRGQPNYPLFVLAAILSWEFFSRSTRNSMAMTLSKERSMRQVAFPKSVIPLAATLSEVIHFVFAIGVFIVFALAFGVHPTPFALLALPIVLVQFAFTLGLAFFFAGLNVFFRDTYHLTDYVFRMWFYLSPGLYTVDLIPKRYRPLYELNPFATFFKALRSVLLDGQMPSLSLSRMVGVTAISIFVLLAGYGYFISVEPSFAKVD